MKKLVVLLSIGLLVCQFSSCGKEEPKTRSNKITVIEDGVSTVVCKIKADTIVIDEVKVVVYPIEDERWCYIRGKYADVSARVFVRLRTQHPTWETISVSLLSGSETTNFALGIFQEKNPKSVPE
ncbi:MAG: hypothetical protein LBO09_02250 [Candidatus Peribacteria bacterium]|jgi:hypothetical protein|nr:hypothetical protein [Candidatus Peribacteria bacterium]